MMMKYIIMVPLACCTMLFGQMAQAQSDNPLLNEFDTPYGSPPFNQIKETHFLPAFEVAMAMQMEVIEEIIAEANPTFSNTYEKFERSFYLLNRIESIFENLLSANSTETLQYLAREIKPMLSKHRDDIYSDVSLYNKLTGLPSSLNIEDSEVQKELRQRYENAQTQSEREAIERKADQLASTDAKKESNEKVNRLKLDLDKLSEEEKMLVSEIQKKFIRNGVELSEKNRDRLKEINSRLALLSVQFSENVLNDIKYFQYVVEDEKRLSGLPPYVKRRAQRAAKENKVDGWLFTLSPPSLNPVLNYADDRDFRFAMMKAHLSKGQMEGDRMNGPLIKEIVSLRHERARMLGYNSHADYILEDNMAKTPFEVKKLLDNIWSPALQMVHNEANAIKAMISAEGEGFELEPWDWAYYTEKIRKRDYGLDQEEIRQYFEVGKVKEGFFLLAESMWGITFNEISNVAKYHRDIDAYEVIDRDGSLLGVIYMDLFARSEKRGGAWMSSFRKQYIENDGQRSYPIVTIVCNFTAPLKKQPSLLTLRETETFFHEMGHALHGLFSNVKYQMLSGTSVPRDFVELPSQLMENWVLDPQIVKKYAIHFRTGKAIPDDLLQKIEDAKHFNSGFQAVEYLAAAYLDLRYHSEESSINLDYQKVEFITSSEIKLPSYIPFRYNSTYFNHIFSGGYSSGYYSYIWSEVLDADAFQAFLDSGNSLDVNTAQRFRESILEKGGTRNAENMYSDFRGRRAIITPLLKRRGLM